MIMATRDFTKSAKQNDEPNPGGEYVLVGSRFAYRNDKNVLVIHKTGDKVELNDEQAQRLRAGKPGSPFQYERDLEDGPELEEVAVANEATTPAERDGFQASAEQTTNRRRVVPKRPDTPKEDEEDTSDVPEPTTSVAGKTPAAKK